MRNIATIGGMGSGKTELAKAIQSLDPTVNILYMSMYGARIPMTLAATTHPDLLKLSKQEYIEAILSNQHVPLLSLVGQRQQMDEFERKVLDAYGNDIFASIALGALVPGVQNLADNVIIVPNVKQFKDRGFYIVGCTCDFYSRVERCYARKKDIDPKERVQIAAQIRKTDNYFESDWTIKLADIVYDTTALGKEDYQGLAREVLAATR